MMLNHRRKKIRSYSFQNTTEIGGASFDYATHSGKFGGGYLLVIGLVLKHRQN